MTRLTHVQEGQVRPSGTPWKLAAAFLVLIRDQFYAERARWVLCVPVFLGVGIACYFMLSDEPPIWMGAAAISMCLIAIIGLRRKPALLIILTIAFLVALGFSAAQIKTAYIAAPVLDRKLGPVWVVGDVTRIEVRAKGTRLWIQKPVIERLSGPRTPLKIRVRVMKLDPALLLPGDQVKLLAILHPPSGPAAPGAFDFARRAYFLRLGAVGYAIRTPELLKKASASGFSIRLAALRQQITQRIHEALPGRTGTVAAALMTGERGAIPDDILTAMRESGLAHLLAISGLHIGLVAGLLFFSVRLCLSLWERVALRHAIKKWAAVAALLGSLGYLLISGITLPTQRAFLMLCFVMLAIVIDRSAISMNLVAWAAMAILLIAPESLMSVSFQMSFAAVTALVATYEYSLVSRPGGARRSTVMKVSLYFSAVLLTTLVAGLATAPFAIYHFNQMALYGMLANFLAVPLTALWIMPWAVLAFVLMPMGLESMALLPMGGGIDLVIFVAKFVQALPGAVAAFPAMPPWSLAFVAIGGLWMCLWLTTWRLFGVALVSIGLAGIATVETPDILISDTGKMVAVKQSDGRLAFVSHPRGFVAETWIRRTGTRVSPGSKAPLDVPPLANVRCDALGCIIGSRGHVVAVVRNVAALTDDCARANLVISLVPVNRKLCSRPTEVIDRFSLWKNGPHAVWLGPGKIKAEHLASSGGKRPWSRYPRSARKL